MSFKNSRKEKISNKEKKKKEGFVGNIKEGLTNGKGKGKGKGGSKGKKRCFFTVGSFYFRKCIRYNYNVGTISILFMAIADNF